MSRFRPIRLVRMVSELASQKKPAKIERQDPIQLVWMLNQKPASVPAACDA
jgi:hypothetical protein